MLRERKMLKKILVFCLSVVIFFLFSGCKDKIKPGNTGNTKNKKITTKVGIAKINNYPVFYEAVGTINAKTSTLISGKVFGVVKKIYVHGGTRVKKGDLLAEIDDRQVSAQLENAMAMLAGARKNLIAAKSEKNAARTEADFAFTTLKRYKRLLKEQSVSPQEFDSIKTKYHRAVAALSGAVAMVESAASRVNQAKAGVETAKIHKNDTLIKAPYPGRITKKFIEVGDLSSPGTLLFSLETQGKFQADFSVPEKYIDKVYLNQKLDVTIPSMGNITIKGIIVRIDPAADPLTRSFNVKVNLKEIMKFKDMKFRSGVFVRIALPVGREDMILLPETAVIHHGQLTGFYLVDDRQTARFRLIRTGRAIKAGKENKNYFEIISGINVGDHYIIHPPLNMEDNVLVNMKDNVSVGAK